MSKISKKNSPFSGIIAGFILIIIGTGLLWWNEGNNVKNVKTVKEITKNVVDIKSTSVDSQYDGKLVATNGELIVEDAELQDSDFSISIKTPNLMRIVEMYQWEEDETSDDDGTSYSYKKVWSDQIINSNTFNRSSGHENPNSMPYESNNYYAENVKVGAYNLTDSQIKDLTANAKEIPSDVNIPVGYRLESDYLTNSVDLDKPKVGDIRISWKYNNWKNVSVLAKLSGNTFTDYVSKSDKTVNRVEEGLLSGEEMIQHIQNENNTLKWILRLVGLLLICFGYMSLISPISKLASFVPILGGIVGGVLAGIAFLIGLIQSLFVIAIAWIRFRPILGIILIVLCIGLIILIKSIVSKNKNNQPETVSES